MPLLIPSIRLPQTLARPCSPHPGEAVEAGAAGALEGAVLPGAASEEEVAGVGSWFRPSLEAMLV